MNPGSTVTFTRKNLPMRRPIVPQQSNGSDCGVFLLHFVEKFVENPQWDPAKVCIFCFKLFFPTIIFY